jgi:ankyrin repeat protein
VRSLCYGRCSLWLIAFDRFRWVYCQLDAIRQCFPSSIRRILNELPTTLDETYERALEGIPRQKRQHAHRLFQYLVAAIRPLHVEELAEIFAIEFEQGGTANLMEGWRPENPEEAILSACSTLIAVVEVPWQRSHIVQFSHFSVKEFLTSDRLHASEDINLRDYHIPLDAAHYVLTQACLTILLQLDETINKKRLAKFPLASYAAEHWYVHAKYEDVAPRVQDAMEQLFNPSKPYLAAWVWKHDVDRERLWFEESIAYRPSPPKATALYYAVSCGLYGPAKYLISTHGENVNAECGLHGSPLHAASSNGHADAVALLLESGANVNMTNKDERTPLCAAYDGRHLEAMRILLERGATVDVPYDSIGSLVHIVSFVGQAEVLRLLLQHGVDINGAAERHRSTPLHWASYMGHMDVAHILLEHGAEINALSLDGTPLFYALTTGRLEVVRLLLEHGADVHIRTPGRKTPFGEATDRGHTQTAQLLLEYGTDKEYSKS